MRMFLSHDAKARRLMLVFAGLYNGQHERTEYTVVGSDGAAIRQGQEYDGTAVCGSHGDYYIRAPHGGHIPVRTLPGERAETVKTPCRRLASKSGRARCELCQPV